MPPLVIDIVSDAVCPWCFVGKRRLDAALASGDAPAAEVRWRPFQLDATIPAEGLDRQAYTASGRSLPGSALRCDNLLALVMNRTQVLHYNTEFIVAYDDESTAPLLHWLQKRRDRHYNTR